VIVAGGLLTGLGMLTFAVIMAATFRGAGRVVASNIAVQPRRVVKLS
jgi:hypothetical protein